MKKTRFAGACQNKGVRRRPMVLSSHFHGADDIWKGASQRGIPITLLNRQMPFWNLKVRPRVCFEENRTRAFRCTPNFLLSDVPADYFNKVLNFLGMRIFSHINCNSSMEIPLQTGFILEGPASNNLDVCNQQPFLLQLTVFTADRICSPTVVITDVN